MSFASVGRRGGAHAHPARSFPHAVASRTVAALALSSLALAPLTAQAPRTGWVEVVVTGDDRAPIAAAIVTLTPVATGAAPRSSLTGTRGTVLLGPVDAGVVALRVRRLGLRDATRGVTVVAGDTVRLAVTLERAPQSLGAIRVVALRGDLVPDQTVDRDRLAAVVPHDAAEVLRELPGTDAMRRGGTALDPVVRGLRDTQLGIYVDAARTFPGGPAGMDTPLSHVDPAHVQGMEVISGPYALTWGAGNLSAIRVTTDPLPPAGARPLTGRFTSGYDGNLRGSEVAASLAGAVGPSGRVRWAASAAQRQGSDYTDGAGRLVQGDFFSREGRARLGVSTGRYSTLAVLAARQEQRDIDYPGRPLDAAFFNTYQLQAEWTHRAPRDSAHRIGALLVRDVDAMAYVYDVDHLMDNDDKPTALPNPSRVPPFALRINTASGVRVLGGRTAVRLEAPAGWELQVGGDVYHADHDASRRTERRDNGALVNRGLIWGGAWIQDAGAFVRGERSFGRARVATTVRLDAVRAGADSASAFFTTQNGTDLSSSELNWSGATTVRVPLTPAWAMTAGLGSVVRTAEANERFSDRAAAKRAQTNAEFLGDPRLRPERSTQGDLWLEGRLARVQLQLNAFARWMDDYITIEATNLPRAQAGSPPPVFRFVNGRARYHGGEATASSFVGASWQVSGSVAYLRGQDLTLAEPALGVTPLRGDVRLRWAPAGRGWFVEGTTRLAGRQERVAVTRGERVTPGWTTVDLQAGHAWSLRDGRTLRVRAGVRNLLDRAYVQHLSALDAFSGGRLFEPGRVVFARVTLEL